MGFFYKKSKVLLVEGIHDKYALEIFSQFSNKGYVIMPCVNAESIYNNLPNLIAYGKKYKASWDNDEEGLTYYNKAVKNFGKIEAHNFNVLPNLFNKKKVRMEEMFEKEDFSMLKKILEIPDNSSYSNIMTSLISSDESIIKLAQSQLSNNAKKAFEELEIIIK